ncbi:hypothetical protein [Methylobacterium nigriterrae]
MGGSLAGLAAAGLKAGLSLWSEAPVRAARAPAFAWFPARMGKR